jgi:hypothetical protein
LTVQNTILLKKTKTAADEVHGHGALEPLTIKGPTQDEVYGDPQKQSLESYRTPRRSTWTRLHNSRANGVIAVKAAGRHHLDDCRRFAQLGTNGLICDQQYRTEHDAGVPTPD